MASVNITANTDDGYIEGFDGGSDFGAARTTSTSSDAAGTGILVGQAENAGAYVRRGYARFNGSGGSGVLVGATITAVTLNVYLKTPFSDGADIVWVNLHAWVSTLAGNRETDYDMTGTDTASSPLTSSGDGKVANDLLTITLPNSWVPTDGSYFGVQFLTDNDNNWVDPPGGRDEGCELWSANQAGKEPYIAVTYTPAAPSATSNVTRGLFGRPLGGKL